MLGISDVAGGCVVGVCVASADDVSLLLLLPCLSVFAFLLCSSSSSLSLSFILALGVMVGLVSSLSWMF